MSEEEEEVKDTLVEEILQQGDTAIIYPEAPEDEQSPAETGNADENGNKAPLGVGPPSHKFTLILWMFYFVFDPLKGLKKIIHVILLSH